MSLGNGLEEILAIYGTHKLGQAHAVALSEGTHGRGLQRQPTCCGKSVA